MEFTSALLVGAKEKVPPKKRMILWCILVRKSNVSLIGPFKLQGYAIKKSVLLIKLTFWLPWFLA